LSDERLVTCLLAGEQDALAVLFDRYHKLVFSVAVRIVNDPGEAEEVVQTVFLDFFRTNTPSLRGLPAALLDQLLARFSCRGHGNIANL